MTTQALLDRIEELEALLGVDEDFTTRLSLQFKLSRSCSTILGHVYKRNMVTRDSIYTVLYGCRADDQMPSVRVIDQFVWRIRRKMKPVGVEINQLWGSGYVMPLASKEKMYALIRRDVTA